MEQKNIDKIKKAALEIIRQEKEINNKYRCFASEFFTPDICKMLYAIGDAKHRCYQFDFSNEFSLVIYDTSNQFLIRERSSNNIITQLQILSHDMLNGSFAQKDYYADSDVDMVVKHAKRIATTNYWTNYVYHNLEAIIADITDQYKEVTERQSDQLDDILASLGVENEPIKHIRVTVEWL